MAAISSFISFCSALLIICAVVKSADIYTTKVQFSSPAELSKTCLATRTAYCAYHQHCFELFEEIHDDGERPNEVNLKSTGGHCFSKEEERRYGAYLPRCQVNATEHFCDTCCRQYRLQVKGIISQPHVFYHIGKKGCRCTFQSKHYV